MRKLSEAVIKDMRERFYNNDVDMLEYLELLIEIANRDFKLVTKEERFLTDKFRTVLTFSINNCRASDLIIKFFADIEELAKVQLSDNEANLQTFKKLYKL